jgi:hypothetical protein
VFLCWCVGLLRFLASLVLLDNWASWAEVFVEVCSNFVWLLILWVWECVEGSMGRFLFVEVKSFEFIIYMGLQIPSNPSHKDKCFLYCK